MPYQPQSAFGSIPPKYRSQSSIEYSPDLPRMQLLRHRSAKSTHASLVFSPLIGAISSPSTLEQPNVRYQRNHQYIQELPDSNSQIQGLKSPDQVSHCYPKELGLWLGIHRGCAIRSCQEDRHV